MAPAQEAMSLRVPVLPFRLHPRLLYLESCGDLSTFTTEGEQLAERRSQRAEHKRPHSLIGVVRETVLWAGFFGYSSAEHLCQTYTHCRGKSSLANGWMGLSIIPFFFNTLMHGLQRGWSFYKDCQADCKLTFLGSQSQLICLWYMIVLQFGNV